MLNKDVKQFGKKFMFDGLDETCWNSDQVQKHEPRYSKTWGSTQQSLIDARHKKTGLKVFVDVIPKEGWARVDHRSYSLKVGVSPSIEGAI